MKKVIGLFIIAFTLFLFLLTACGPKPYYKTAVGKKKQKHYNNIQFGGSQHVVQMYGNRNKKN